MRTRSVRLSAVSVFRTLKRTIPISQVTLVVKNLPPNSGDIGDTSLIPGSGRSPGGGHSNPLQHSCLENGRDGEAGQATVHRVPKSQTQLKRLSTHAILTTLLLDQILSGF